MTNLNVVILGLSITSSWGNGHAVTYRGLVREIAALGHRVLFLERNVPWYAGARDMPYADWVRIGLYNDLAELKNKYAIAVKEADLVIVGSYVPEGVAVCEWVLEEAGGITAFYDIDTPVTLAKLKRGDHEYLKPDLIPRFHLYFSFTGGPTLDLLEKTYGSPAARALYCCADTRDYHPQNVLPSYDLGYMGTYSEDRQPPLEKLMLEPARQWREGKFIVAGSQFPDSISWPENTLHIHHLSPKDHCGFYNSQRFTLNVTREDMIESGWSPSVRLFEAAACGTPIISDHWPGLDAFFTPDEEILISKSAEETLFYLRNLTRSECRKMAERAREKVMDAHTATHRARELENHVFEAAARKMN